jgi:hypothetical protein
MSVTFRGARFSGHQSFTPGAPMTEGDLRRVAPSIFAVEPHASRSSQYTYIPTFEVLSGLQKAGFVPVRAIQGKSRTEGKAEFTKHMIRLQHPDYANRTSLQGVAPEVVLLNSHDGTSSYRMLSGVFRSICTNSMIVMEDGATDIRVPHKGDILGKVIEGSFEVIGESRITLERVEDWQGVQLNRDEQLVLAEAAHVLRFGEEGNAAEAIKPERLLAARRFDDQGADLWRTHNRLQENMIRGGLAGVMRDDLGRRRNVTTREVRGIDGDIKLNRAMWLLSHRMAELKAAA